MSTLTNKQEGFVQSLLKGKTQRQAYKDNYNAENMADTTIDEEACKMLASPKVATRHAQLQGRTRARVEEQGLLTATDILRKMEELIKRNENIDDRIALDGLKTYGKQYSLFTDKVVNTNLNYEMTEEEADNILSAEGISVDNV